MRRSPFGSLLILLAVSALGMSGCSPVTYHSSFPDEPSTGPAKSQGHGPPDHAPAHGYRAKSHDGVELVFRSELGVYAVVNVSDYYYSDGRYFRVGSGNWSVSAQIGGPWQPIANSKIPPGLQKSKHSKSKGKAKGHTK